MYYMALQQSARGLRLAGSGNCSKNLEKTFFCFHVYLAGKNKQKEQRKNNNWEENLAIDSKASMVGEM